MGALAINVRIDIRHRHSVRNPSIFQLLRPNDWQQPVSSPNHKARLIEPSEFPLLNSVASLVRLAAEQWVESDGWRIHGGEGDPARASQAAS
jgi:hypothetical protein